LEIVFDGISFQSITSYTISIKVQNVSNATLVLNSLTGVVSINGNDLGNVSSFQTVEVAPNSEQVINIKMDLSLLGIPGLIQNVINSVRGTYTFELKGHANVNNLLLPFDLTNEITI
jgi:LEA14-like dessication related protein